MCVVIFAGDSMTSRLSKNAGDKRCHTQVVRSFPEDPAADWTDRELGKEFSGFWRNSVRNFVTPDSAQCRVTAYASSERVRGAAKIKSPHNFDELRSRGMLPDGICAEQPGFSNERAISAQKGSLFAERNIDKLIVDVVSPVERVEPEHAEEGGEFAEVNIEHKSGLPQRPGADVGD